jgi:drug/metabolite transporter (DMT)-like permease
MRGAIFMMLAACGFVFNDAIIKSAGEELGLYQILFLRGLLATALLGLLSWRFGAFRNMQRYFTPMMGLRMIAEVAATVTFLMALFRLPLATATAILQVMPLAVTLGAVIFLKEQVRWRRYAAILTGFAGVMLIIQPGTDGFSPWSALLLLTVAFAATRDLATRQLPAETPSIMVAFLTSAAITLLGGAGSVVEGWAPVEPRHIFMLAGAACFLVVAYFFTVTTVRIGDISFTAPFRYTGLVWAIILDIFVFNILPGTLMMIGAVIVVASGIYSFMRERQKGSAQPTGSRFPGRLH